MYVKVLGAAAGGGLPQWNCGCANCADARAGRIAPMTQSSIAVSADGAQWVVLNASPDIRAQVQACPALHPRALRESPIRAVVVTNADVDHIAGLLTLREKTGFDLYATADIHDTLRANSVFDVMDRALVMRRTIALDTPFSPLPGLLMTPFSVPGKVALFLEGDTVGLQDVGEQTIGLLIECGGRQVAHVPGCAALPDWLLDRLARVKLLLFDGTVWENDDMARTGTGAKTGARMGHLPMQGNEGSIARLADLPARKVFIHINNTNPVLQPHSPERAAVTAAGWEIAWDGQEFTL
jgi:pyrroloquinoline quinone biosynthesis protein B